MKSKGFSLKALSLSLGASMITILSSANPVTVSPLLSPLPDGYVERAENMMQAGNWQGAVDCLLELTVADGRLNENIREKASFLLAKAMFLNGDPEALSALIGFCSDYPASVYALEARLLTADCYFASGDFRKAASIYRSIPAGALLPEQRNLYTYRLALALLETDDYDESRSLFNKIRSSNTWRIPARYYLSYIDLKEGELDRAYKGFSEVASVAGDDKELAPEWYMTQIEFLNGNYGKAAEDGAKLLRNDRREELVKQMDRVVGLSFFREGNLSEAVPYLEDALKPVVDEQRDSQLTEGELDEVTYALGVCRYDNRQYESAAELFRRISDRDSAVGQGALLYLGQCYVESGNDDAAALSFRQASAMDYDTDVTQASLFNYIASRTHGGNVPFATGIHLYNEFLDRFPDSPYAPAVRENLASAYFNEKDYKAALENINAIHSPSRSVLEIKQKVLYQLGRQLLASGHAADAEKILAEGVSVISPRNALSAETALWLGDARYVLKNYSGATTAYREALAGKLTGSNAALARYNLAYSLYMQDNYSQAAAEFARAYADRSLSAELRGDAKVRLADCRYYTGDYNSAAELYADALAGGGGEPDYAAYRHAVMLGLEGRRDAKIVELQEFSRTYPRSRWNVDVLMELAQTYIDSGKENEAIKTLEHLINTYPSSPRARKGSLTLGSMLLKSGNESKGENYLKALISNYPSSEEASLADTELRNYHASNGTLKEYADFLASVPGAPGIAADEMESLQFAAARNSFVDNPEEISGLLKYVKDYPDGTHLAPALLMIAKSNAWYGDPAEAVDAVNLILETRPGASETVEGLMLKGETIEKYLPERKKEALATYKMLEKIGGTDLAPVAYAGIMRNSDNPSERIEYAGKVLRSGGLAAESVNEARLYRALGWMEAGKKDEGVKELTALAADPNNEPGSQASVELASYMLKSGKVSQAMEFLSRFTTSGVPCAECLAEGYLLMSDGYRAQGNDYMAKEYLESLKENYPGDDKKIIEGIESRLKALSSGKKK